MSGVLSYALGILAFGGQTIDIPYCITDNARNGGDDGNQKGVWRVHYLAEFFAIVLKVFGFAGSKSPPAQATGDTITGYNEGVYETSDGDLAAESDDVDTLSETAFEETQGGDGSEPYGDGFGDDRSFENIAAE